MQFSIQLWPIVKEFWQELGFIVNVEQPDAGVMETDWAENRARVDSGAIRNFLGRVLDSVYSTAERDKYRTRLERGGEPVRRDNETSDHHHERIVEWQQRCEQQHVEAAGVVGGKHDRTAGRDVADADRLRAELVGRGAPEAVATRLVWCYGSTGREVWALAEADAAL